MKKTFRKLLLLFLVLVLAFVFSLAACGKKAETPSGSLWDSAAYLENAELGEGNTTLCVEVKAEEKSVMFTLHTDKQTVGEALLENSLIGGEAGDYGMYVKVVNGITADYDVDQSYWAFYINEEYAVSGVDTTPIEAGSEYQLVYAK